jgi:hypothetical protein
MRGLSGAASSIGPPLRMAAETRNQSPRRRSAFRRGFSSFCFPVSSPCPPPFLC